MNKIYIYSDEESCEVLLNEQQKIISIGSDFGYGDFGNIIQHCNSLNFAKKTKKFATISVMAANAIGFKDFPSWIRKACGSDAVIFISEYPLILDENSPSLVLVGEIKNLAAVHMYGGGLLNNMWGDHILGLVEYFLRLAPHADYFVSGQQITPPYQSRVLRHIEEFKPKLFGVRDEISRQCLKEVGFTSSFSFDDATEVLSEISKKLLLKSGRGVLMHLNVSNYTANDWGVNRIGDDLKLLSEKIESTRNLTLFQAFKDNRQDFLDSREALKFLDYRFPFNDFRVVELVPFAYGAESVAAEKPVVGEIGYSCSYHVALCLQLAGIPCWLRSSNPFYDQKSKALQVDQDFSSFLQEPRLADHRVNLERREKWLDVFEKALDNTPEVTQVSRVPENNDGSAPWPFFFKGRPTLEEKLELAEQKNTILNKRIDESDLVRELRVQVEGFREQLTAVGFEVHRQRVEFDEKMAEIFRSRSWRITRPLRAISSLVRHGRFDSRGLYGLMQGVGRRLPISADMRSRIGRLLRKQRS